MSDLGTQFTVLRALEETAVPAPRPYLYEADPPCSARRSS